MTPPLTTRLTDLLSRSSSSHIPIPITIPTILRTHPVPLTLLATVSLPLLYTLYSDYTSWLLLGRGGLPHNPLGYFVQLLLSPLKASRFETGPFEKAKTLNKSKPFTERTFLKGEDIPVRDSERPKVGKWILPQRQLDQKGSEKAFENFNSLLATLIHQHPSLLHIDNSILEGSQGPALYLSSSAPRHPSSFGTRSEIVHLHPSEGSIHVSLAPKDAKLVIEKGWGERFGLSGSIMPLTYVMIYAPREGEEEEGDLRVRERVVRAAVGFMLGLEMETVGEDRKA